MVTAIERAAMADMIEEAESAVFEEDPVDIFLNIHEGQYDENDEEDSIYD